MFGLHLTLFNSWNFTHEEILRKLFCLEFGGKWFFWGFQLNIFIPFTRVVVMYVKFSSYGCLTLLTDLRILSAFSFSYISSATVPRLFLLTWNLSSTVCKVTHSFQVTDEHEIKFGKTSTFSMHISTLIMIIILAVLKLRKQFLCNLIFSFKLLNSIFLAKKGNKN